MEARTGHEVTEIDQKSRQVGSETLVITTVPGNQHGSAVTSLSNSDFDGNGLADILWRNSATGSVALWNDGTGHGPVIGLNPVWQLAAAEDFTGDGGLDALWRNTDTGAVALWTFDAAGNATKGAVQSVHQDWRIEATGDFDADGGADILWRSPDAACRLGDDLDANTTQGRICNSQSMFT